MGLSLFSVAPRAARRAALSRAIKASSPILTNEVFSRTPVSSEARDSAASSMLSVVLIHISMHNGYVFVKGKTGRRRRLFRGPRRYSELPADTMAWTMAGKHGAR